MKQAYMLPIQKQWVDMIRSGVKEYEFRPYALEVGKTVYIYESLGKKKKCNEDCIHCDHYVDHRYLDLDGLVESSVCEFKNYSEDESVYLHEGAGAIVGEFVVEECYEVKEVVGGLNEYKLFDKQGRYCDLVTGEYLEKLGYTNQRYAIKISQLKFYDKPIPKEEFISYSKTEKLENELSKIEQGEACGIPIDYASFTHYTQWEKDKDNYGKITFAPQRAIKVVEREDL